LTAAHPGLGPLLPHLRVAVNQAFVSAGDPVPDGAEVALIPPVSGGAGRFHVVDAPLELQQVMDAVAGEAFGGLVTFTGSVRNATRGREVVRLEYEAYAPMAVAMFERIAAEVDGKWPGVRLAITHRVGVLRPGELAVVMAAAAPHRAEAFAACSFALERLKADAPIWKREVYADGAEWVGLGP
ncbi:MAG: molybdenum cofactor biosynthesis protein MoaE, partial [Deltaproteobacteria bacterium]|nr:molybdenum cofactor biosynthesis protein MoaE [Deltaproteobacteria bacterium]